MHCCHVLFRVIRCCCSPFFSHSSFGPSTAICAARFELSARPHLLTCILMGASFPCHAVRICLALEFSFVFLLAQNSSHGLLYARWGPDYFFGRVGRPAGAWAAAATLTGGNRSECVVADARARAVGDGGGSVQCVAGTCHVSAKVLGAFLGSVGGTAAATLVEFKQAWLQMRVHKWSGTTAGRFSWRRALVMCELKCLQGGGDACVHRVLGVGRWVGRRQRHYRWRSTEMHGCTCACTSGRGRRRVGPVCGGHLSCVS